VGLWHGVGRELDSADVAVDHAGRGMVRTNGGGIAPDEYLVALGEHGSDLSGFPAAHWNALAKRRSCRSVWLTPPACGIRGLGGGTEGCLEHPVLVAGDLDVCRICQKTCRPRRQTEVENSWPGPIRDPLILRGSARTARRSDVLVQRVFCGPGFFCVGFDE